MMPVKQNRSLVSLEYLLGDMLQISSDILVANLRLDTRNIEPNDVFIAVAGSQAHGMMYADQAIKMGAIAIIYDPAAGGKFLAEKVKKEHAVCLLEMANLKLNISTIAARFYQHPARELSVIGITGTNGKTSVSHFVAQALNLEKSAADEACAVIGTLGWGSVKNLKKTINTTPDAVSVQRQLATLLEDRTTTVAMEVSSHGLDQGRVNAVEFKGAVFTNLSHDHLDYHQTLEAYGEAKLALFKSPSLEFVVLNSDDEFYENIIKVLPATVKVYTFSRSQKQAAVKDCLFISNAQLSTKGLLFELSFNGQKRRVQSALFGDFNIDNICATIGVLLAMGCSFEMAINKAKAVKGVLGRMQLVSTEDSEPTVIVDYAHTPDALKLALLSLREHCAGSLKLVFGCGGNRDEAKRPLMGSIAAELADRVVITNDNPRLEPAESIAEQIALGAHSAADLTVILDRQQAIRQSIATADAKDIILVAGKGHEDYQQIGHEKIAFSDIAQVEEALKLRWLADSGEDGCKP